MTDSAHPTMETLFANLDRWRHFAGFPLEARVDAIIGLFLPEVIEKRCGAGKMHSQVIPQFPLKKSGNNQSDKVDFFALSKDGSQAFLVEVKTDMSSLRDEQKSYLRRAKERGLSCILREFVEIAAASESKRKYLHLIDALTELKLLESPCDLKKVIKKNHTQDYKRIIRGICIPDKNPKIEVLFVQPKGCTDEFSCISFQQFASSIKSRGELGCLLAKYLRRWITPPGESPSEKA